MTVFCAMSASADGVETAITGPSRHFPMQPREQTKTLSGAVAWRFSRRFSAPFLQQALPVQTVTVAAGPVVAAAAIIDGPICALRTGDGVASVAAIVEFPCDREVQPYLSQFRHSRIDLSTWKLAECAGTFPRSRLLIGSCEKQRAHARQTRRKGHLGRRSIGKVEFKRTAAVPAFPARRACHSSKSRLRFPTPPSELLDELLLLLELDDDDEPLSLLARAKAVRSSDVLTARRSASAWAKADPASAPGSALATSRGSASSGVTDCTPAKASLAALSAGAIRRFPAGSPASLFSRLRLPHTVCSPPTRSVPKRRCACFCTRADLSALRSADTTPSGDSIPCVDSSPCILISDCGSAGEARSSSAGESKEPKVACGRPMHAPSAPCLHPSCTHLAGVLFAASHEPVAFSLCE